MDSADTASFRATTASPSPWLEPDELWDRHGPALYAMACLLVDDEADAVLAVTLGMMEVYRIPQPEPTLRRAARYVHRHCVTLEPNTVDPAVATPAMARLGEVARLQRSALALCLFGGHTYRDAAAELGIATEAVAWLLISGLRELGDIAR